MYSILVFINLVLYVFWLVNSNFIMAGLAFLSVAMLCLGVDYEDRPK